MSELQRYTDIKIICDAVEKAAIKRSRKGHRTSAKVAALNSLLSTDQLLHGVGLGINAMRTPTSLEVGEQGPVQEGSQGNSGGESGAGAGAKDENWDWRWCPPDYPGDDWDIAGEYKGMKESVGFDWDPFAGVMPDQDDAISKLLGLEPGEDLAEGFENCFDCDLRLKFDFQLQPINLLLEFDNLLDQIQDILDFWKQYANPLNFLERICDFWDFLQDMGWICIQDYIALLLALQALLAKYANLAISISFDWTLLFGGLLKFILDALAQLIEQIIQLLTAPIDCIIGALKMIDELMSTLIDTANVAAAFGQTMTGMGDGGAGFGNNNSDGSLDLGPLGNYTGAGSKMSVDASDEWGSGGPDIFGKEQGIIPAAGPESDPNTSVAPGLKVKRGAMGSDLGSGGGGLSNESGDKKLEIPTGFNMAGKNGLEEALKDPAFKYSSPLQKVILALEEAKKWITTLFTNILFALKSLSALVGGGINLNLQNIGLLMMILDIINLIKLLASLKGVNPCSDNIKDIAEFIKRFHSGSEVEIKGDVILVSQGDYTQEVVLRKSSDESCSVFDLTGVRDTSEETYNDKDK